ncbi:MAG: hypothetical protein EXR27_00035 [Betaproteobacteria bacterium]|nr:hypothetical protein [Betaproteobacteria bacterium]
MPAVVSASRHGDAPAAVAAAVNAAAAGQALQDRLQAYGMNVRANTSEQFAAEIRRESAQWAKIIKDKGIRAD